jgi:beta-alanine--pyruvate transaminase
MKIETSQFSKINTKHCQDDMQAYWMPYTPNRYFRKNPKVMASAKGVYYTDDHGRKLFDGASGLWTSPLGHGDPRIIEAIQKQYQTMDYVPAFQMASKETFRLANRITQYAPADLGKVFFVNSGSEAVDTALKMAIAYHRARGESSRTRMIGRERAYHGGCVGGISVGGIPTNRKMFSPMMMPGVDHLPHTLNLSQMAFSRGQPTWGAHLADDLERLVLLHDASNIAAVILEPVQGSTGVIVPPVGYLEKIREICTKHGILLIFDEVITGFGRLAANFGADRFGVKPDMITFAKAITNGVIPMGGIIAHNDIYETITGSGGQEQLIEFFHGFTYSGHPLATAAAHACLDIFEDDDILARTKVLEQVLGDAAHSLKGMPGIMDIRNCGVSAAFDLEPIAGKPGLRGMQVLESCIEHGVLVRITGDTIAMGPPFVATTEEVQSLVETFSRVIQKSFN